MTRSVFERRRALEIPSDKPEPPRVELQRQSARRSGSRYSVLIVAVGAALVCALIAALSR